MFHAFLAGLAVLAVFFGFLAYGPNDTKAASNLYLSLSSNLIANNTTAIVVKSTPGQVYHVEGFSNHTATGELYVKLYDATSGTCGSGTPVWRQVIPYGSSSGAGYISIDFGGLQFVNGIVLCATGGYADNDTTAPAASTFIVNVGYK